MSTWQDKPAGYGFHWMVEWMPSHMRWSKPLPVWLLHADEFLLVDSTDETDELGYSAGQGYYTQHECCEPRRWLAVAEPSGPEGGP